MKIRAWSTALLLSLSSFAHAEGGTGAMDEGHTFYFPTALQKPAGTFAMKGYYFGFWDTEYTFNEHVSAGLSFMVPIGAFVLAPFVKATVDVAPKIHLGVYASGGFFQALGYSEGHAGYVQGGPLITFGDNQGAFTLGLLNQRVMGDNYRDRWRFTFNASGFWSFSPRLKGILELYAPFTAGDTTNGYGVTVSESIAKLIGYGIRYGGESVSGDIGFIIPIYDGMSEFLRYLPMGFPFVSLNLAW